MPYNPVTGQRASVSDPATWGSFDQAAADSGAMGVGFVLTPQDPFVALDFDGVLTDSGPAPWAADILKRLRSYTEVSQSGHGLHVIALANSLRSAFVRKFDVGSLEVYHRARYIAMTGDLYPGSVLEPIDADKLILEIVAAGQRAADQPNRSVKASADELAERCAWLAHCRDDAAELTEPEWYAMLSIVGRCEDGAEDAQVWSSPHPGYSAPDTASKLNRAITTAGPRTCSSVSREFGDDYCHSCALNGKIKTPLHAAGRPKQVDLVNDAIAQGRDPAMLLDGFHRTEKGNADRIIRAHGQDILAYEKWVSPLVWDGRRWSDGVSALTEFAKDVAQGLFDLLESPMEAEQAVAHFKWASESESARKIQNAIGLVGKDSRVQVPGPGIFNQDPWLLSCRNAVIDLRTGEAREHSRHDYITEMAEVGYDPDAGCNEWMRFLSTSVSSGAAAFLQRAAGYSLTGLTSEKCLFFLHGPTDSGKSTFVRLLQTLAGSYGKPIPQDMLMAKSWGSHPTEVANLFGCRVAVASETEEGHRINEALVKLLTGGDNLTARRMREDFWNFSPTHKIWLTGNHRPIVKGTDDSIWNRIHIIPFSRPMTLDQDLASKILSEASGILNWLIEGCLDWRSGGLQPPEEMTAAKEAYRQEQDSVAVFLEETIERGAGKLEKTLLYRAYKAWAEQTMGDKYPLGRESFNRRVSEKGFETASDGPAYFWVGMGLRPIPLDFRRVSAAVN